MTKSLRPEPTTSRPNMPGYGIVDEHSGKGLLAWSWAVERLTGAHNYFISTTRPDGRPHCMPIWGVWLDDRFCFSTGAESAKARNLAANSYCVITPERADDAVIVEGIAQKEADADFLKRAGDAYHAKYGYKLDPSLGPIFIVRPRIAFGFIEFHLTETATRWVFPRP